MVQISIQDMSLYTVTTGISDIDLPSLKHRSYYADARTPLENDAKLTHPHTTKTQKKTNAHINQYTA